MQVMQLYREILLKKYFFYNYYFLLQLDRRATLFCTHEKSQFPGLDMKKKIF